jgi:hypothetical protein
MAGAIGAVALATGWSLSTQKSVGVSSSTVVNKPSINAQEVLALAPMRFEANQGQGPAVAKYIARGRGYLLSLTPDGAAMNLSKTASTATTGGATVPTASIRMHWHGAAANPLIGGVDPQQERRNFMVGERGNWHTDVETFNKVRYTGLYPGVDAVFYGNQNELEYDFVVAPGADPGVIRLGFEGADSLSIADNGDLELTVGSDRVVQHAPRIYQEIGGQRREVDGKYVLAANNEVRFQLAAYDADQPLVIDPVLKYSTYLGNTSYDSANAITVDSAGDIYVTGYTNSASFPLSGAYDGTCNGYSGGGTPTDCANSKDVFVTKISGSTGAIVYSTFIGGDSDDVGRGIAVDANGRAFVTGSSEGVGFPTTTANPINSFNQNVAPNSTAGSSFVTVLNAAGDALVYSAFITDTGIVTLRGVGLDADGNVFAAGLINPSNSTISNCPAVDASAGTSSSFHALIVKFTNGTTPAFDKCRMLTTSDGETNPYAMTVEGHSVYLTGRYDAGATNGWDAFIAIYDDTNDDWSYGSDGGTGVDYGWAIDVDGSGNIYVAGSTTSTNFPVSAPMGSTAYDSTLAFEDAFVWKFDSSFNSVYSTYLGGDSQDIAYGIVADADGTAVVTGFTYYSTFPVTATAAQATGGGGKDGFVTRLNASGSALVASTFLGGSGSDEGRAIALSGGAIYVAGETGSTTLPVTTASPHTPAAQISNGGGVVDAFIARIVPGVNLAASIAASPTAPAATQATTITVTLGNAATVGNNVPSTTTPTTDSATNATLGITTPSGMTLGTATASNGGNCTGTGPFNCTFPTLASAANATVSFSATAATAGTYSFSAAASATAPDFDSSTTDNAASLDVVVGSGTGGGDGGSDGGSTGGGSSDTSDDEDSGGGAFDGLALLALLGALSFRTRRVAARAGTD